MTRKPSLKREIHVAVALLCAAALIAIVTVLTGGPLGESGLRLFASAVAIWIYQAVAVPGNALRKSNQAWSWFGLVSVCFCMAGAAAAVWLCWRFDTPGEEVAIKVGAILGVFTLMTAHGSALVLGIRDRSGPSTIARYATFACSFVLALVLVDAIMSEYPPALDERVLAVLGILYALGSIVTPLLGMGERAERAWDAS
jgi:hypothetical protein